jgi:hypothetical protein
MLREFYLTRRYPTPGREMTMSNIQVTHDSSPSNARSESCVAINPNNPMQVVCASKKFSDIVHYVFTLAAAFSSDGGVTWQDAPAFPITKTILSDPTLAWDDAGNVFLIGVSADGQTSISGLDAYKSADGGQNWSGPTRIHNGPDDKEWAAGDSNPSSPFHGRIYVAWNDPGAANLHFARTKDHGTTWIGVGSKPVGTALVNGPCLAPEVNVAADGTVYIVFLNGDTGNTIEMLVSTDGAESFHAKTSPATAIRSIGDPDSAHFPDARFRVGTIPTACVSGQRVVVAWAAWADATKTFARIFFALSNDGGTSWTTPSAGQQLLPAALPAGFQQFQPQIVVDPNGVIGCAFYELGPKPTTPLIDVILARSFDGGASFQTLTVTDQPWDPTVDAPLTPQNATFIGEYFGLDASSAGFQPVFTSTLTGIQELWTAIIPTARCAFIVNRTLGQDEVDARRHLPGGPVVPDVFRVVVDGLSADNIGATGPTSTLPIPLAVPGLTIVPRGNVSDSSSYGPHLQRFTFLYDIDFGPTDAAFNFIGPSEFVTLQVSAGPVSTQAQLELIKQPDPFLLHGDTYWLAVDLRVFVVRAGEAKFGVAGITDATDAPRFIQQLMARITPAQFDSLSADEDQSKLFIQPRDQNQVPVFNFALAKVHYIGQIGATRVRVFFRLFQAQTLCGVFDFPPGARYRRAASNPDGQPIPLAGIEGFEYVTIPFFAEPRIDTRQQSMSQQTDEPNVRNITAHTDGSEVDTFFGCWLDINQPFKPGSLTLNGVLPIIVDSRNPDGPFIGPLPGIPANLMTIQQAILRNLHQCLIAEIAFDPVPIPLGQNPANIDKLAQRNLAWSDVGSALALTTFEMAPTAVGLPASQSPDELMIDWGNTPRGSVGSIYLPSASADSILATASRTYGSHRLSRTDAHTLHCSARGITYVPIPPGTPAVNLAALLTVTPPASLQQGQAFSSVVRQLTNAFAQPVILARGRRRTPAPAAPLIIEWRRVSGAFQLTVPVKAKAILLEPEERDLSVLRWIGETIPAQSRWHLVFRRYLEQIADRVKAFGGNPGEIVPSPTGDGIRKHPHEEHEAFTGKITGLIFDRFGDFEGFLLQTEDGERRFLSRERDVAELAERVWRDRLRITVRIERDAPHRPVSIIIREPPSHFRLP